MLHRPQHIIVSFLRWSEKYTKTDMVYLANGGFWLLFSQAVNFFLSFALIWFFANLLSQEEYGQYRFFTTVIALLALTSLPGMKTAIVRAVAQGTSGVIPQVLRTRIRWGLIGSVGALIAASYYFYQDDVVMSGLFVLVALCVPFVESFDLAQSYHNGRQDYPAYAASTIIRYAIIVASVITALLLTDNMFMILGAYLLSTIVANFLIYQYTLKRFPLSAQSDTETVPYGIKLSYINAFSAIAANVDKIALWYLAGPAQVAIYTITIAIPKEVGESLNYIGKLALPTIAIPKEVGESLNYIGKLALPKMAGRNKREQQQSLLRKVAIFFIATLPLTGAYVLLAPFIFSFFLPQYVDSVHYSQLAALLIPCAPLVLLTQYFQATMHVRALSILSVVQPTVSSALFFVLIPPFGIFGAIYALLGRQLVSFVLMLIFFITDHTE